MPRQLVCASSAFCCLISIYFQKIGYSLKPGLRITFVVFFFLTLLVSSTIKPFLKGHFSGREILQPKSSFAETLAFLQQIPPSRPFSQPYEGDSSERHSPPPSLSRKERGGKVSTMKVLPQLLFPRVPVYTEQQYEKGYIS